MVDSLGLLMKKSMFTKGWIMAKALQGVENTGIVPLVDLVMKQSVSNAIPKQGVYLMDWAVPQAFADGANYNSCIIKTSSIIPSLDGYLMSKLGNRSEIWLNSHNFNKNNDRASLVLFDGHLMNCPVLRAFRRIKALIANNFMFLAMKTLLDGCLIEGTR